jgi:hypothetical protein
MNRRGLARINRSRLAVKRFEGSSPFASTDVMSQDIADRRTYAGYVAVTFGAIGW